MKAKWLGRLETLVADVKRWAEASGWRTRRVTKTIKERPLGSYKAPLLLMEKEAVEVVLNPVARYVPGALGAVDLYLAPAYDDIAGLSFEEDRWVVHDFPPPNPSEPHSHFEVRPMPLTEGTVCEIFGGMHAQA